MSFNFRKYLKPILYLQNVSSTNKELCFELGTLYLHTNFYCITAYFLMMSNHELLFGVSWVNQDLKSVLSSQNSPLIDQKFPWKKNRVSCITCVQLYNFHSKWKHHKEITTFFSAARQFDLKNVNFNEDNPYSFSLFAQFRSSMLKGNCIQHFSMPFVFNEKISSVSIFST